MIKSTTITLLCSVLVSAAAGFTSGKIAATPKEPASQDPQGGDGKSPLSLLRGLDVPVRSRAEAEVTEDTRTVSFEAYYDWDFGNVLLVSESGDIATVDSPRSWEMRSAADSAGEMVAMCFQPSTGKSFVLGQSQSWEPIAERGDMTLGDYEVQVSLTEKGTLSALRINQMTGQTWMLAPAGWVPLPGNLPETPATQVKKGAK